MLPKVEGKPVNPLDCNFNTCSFPNDPMLVGKTCKLLVDPMNVIKFVNEPKVVGTAP